MNLNIDPYNWRILFSENGITFILHTIDNVIMSHSIAMYNLTDVS